MFAGGALFEGNPICFNQASVERDGNGNMAAATNRSGMGKAVEKMIFRASGSVISSGMGMTASS